MRKGVKSEPYYRDWFKKYNVVTNPLGDLTSGINIDSGAINRKLGSDMAQSVTGGFEKFAECGLY